MVPRAFFYSQALRRFCLTDILQTTEDNRTPIFLRQTRNFFIHKRPHLAPR